MNSTKEKIISVDKLDNDNKQKKKIVLKLRFNTHNDDHKSSLFDYRNDQKISYEPCFDNDSLYFYKNENISNISHEEKQIDLPSSCNIIFRARKSGSGYYELIYPILPGSYLDINFINKLDKYLWLIVPTIDPENKYEIENKVYYLEENDIIKISKKKFEVSKLCINNRKKNEKKNKEKHSIFNLAEDRIKTSQDINKDETKKFCKICGGTISLSDNPLLALCECERYLHFECLIKLFEINKDKTNKNVTTYECQVFNCETCYKPYPTKFQVKTGNNFKIFSIIDKLEKPKDNDYIIFENLTYIPNEEKNKNNIKNIYVVKLIEEKMTIGRKSENSIIITIEDKNSKNSISGEHAILNYDKEKGVSIINKGKFGTLVLIKDNIQLNIGNKISLQNMNTIFTAEVIEKIEKEDEGNGDENDEE